MVALAGFAVQLAGGGIDTSAIEQSIKADLESSNQATFTANCPDSAPDVVGSTFLCVAYDQGRTAYPLTVIVHESSVSWASAQP